MIQHVVELSLKFRVLLAGAAVVAMAVAAAQLPSAPIDVFPEYAPVQVQIQAEALGLSAAEVEQLITIPIEHDLLNGVPWLAQIRSESVPGLCSIWLTFKPGTNPLQARQMVQERMTQAHALPNVGSSPVIVPPVSSASRVVMIGLSSKDLSLIDLSTLARWKIKPRLMGVPGVANVTIWGQRDRQLQVEIDPVKLSQNGVTVSQVISTTGNALWSSPLTFVEASTPGTGGFIDTANQRFGIQHISPITTASGLAAVTIEDTGARRLRLDQVAKVSEHHQPLIGDAVLSNGPGVMLVVEKFPGADTRAITDGVEETLTTLRPGLSGVQIDTNVYQAQSFIETALGNLAGGALAGLSLLVLVLALLLFSWRLVVISLAAIVMSLLTAMYVLYLTGVGFNLMTLAGLAAAFGLVVTDSLAGLHAFREQSSTGDGRTAASLGEFAAAVRPRQLAATLIALVAALPLLIPGGVIGAFAGPAVSAYVVAVLSSTLVALVVTPALDFMLLGGPRVGVRRGPLGSAASRLFDFGFARAAKPRWAYATLAVLFAALCTGLLESGAGSLLPVSRDRSLVAHWEAAPGTSLPAMVRITQSAVDELRSVPGVDHVGAHVGRAITSDQVVDVNAGEIWLRLTDQADYGRTLAAIRRVLHGYPGMRSKLTSYPEDRVREVETGSSDPVVVRIYGPDLRTLRGTAEEVRRVLAKVPGVAEPRVEAVAESPTLEVKVDLEKAQRFGINPGDVRRTATTYFSGLLVGNLYQESKILDVVVRGASASGASPASVEDVLIQAPGGNDVRLGDIADVRQEPNPTVIRHDATLRRLDVTARVQGRDLSSVLQDVRGRVRSVPMPLEYHLEVLTASSERQDRNVLTAGAAIGAMIAILLLLQATIGSWRLAAMTLLLLPLSVAGGVLGAFSVGGIGTLPALLGLLAVFSITARNILLLIGSLERIGPAEGNPLHFQEVMDATRAGAKGITLATVATFAALIPFVALGPIAGLEILQPLAVVVLSGLITSFLVTVLVAPTLYLRMAAGAPVEPA